MYKVLVVDDEPRVSTGIRNYLLQSDLQISHVETALNGFEALDYLRMETFDLVLTDIQMSMMNGIELMEAAFLLQPGLPIIVISAHEKSEFAKKSLRLGARDYLIKPVELEELVGVVGRVLMEKQEAGRMSLSNTDWHMFKNKNPFSRRDEALMELLTEKNLQEKDYSELLQDIGQSFGQEDCRYGIALIQLELSKGGFSEREVSRKDRKLLKYASNNIVEESLNDWGGLVFQGFGNRLIAVIPFTEKEIIGSRTSQNAQLSLIGQTIYMNLKQYLNFEATISMSSLNSDFALLPKLMEEAEATIEWSKLHPHNKVFFYEDMVGPWQMSMMEWVTKVEDFVQSLKTAVGDLRLAELNALIESLTACNSSTEWFKSCFGMLVYRLYGLLFEFGHEGGDPFRRLDPDVYFRGLANDLRIETLKTYVQEVSVLLRMCKSERERTIISRIKAYIQNHYRNHSLKIQDIAEEVHFSPAYVMYLFKQEMHKNIWEYVSQIRIEEAKRLLISTDMKRYEISYQVGYESPEHFSRMFKRYTGVSPVDYRKEGQEGHR